MGSLFIDTLPSGMALRPLTGMVLGYTGLVPHELKKKIMYTQAHVCIHWYMHKWSLEGSTWNKLKAFEG